MSQIEAARQQRKGDLASWPFGHHKHNDQRMVMVLNYMAKRICKKQLSSRMRKEEGRVRRNNQRAKQYGNQGVLTLAEWLYIMVLHEWACRFCGTIHNLTMEHLTPLSMGGHTSRANCVPACGPCNSRLEIKN